VLSILVSMVEDHIDMDALMKKLPLVEPWKGRADPPDPGKRSIPAKKGFSPVIAVARDKAFCFYYQDNLDSLTKAGAKIVTFSPLADDQLPHGVDGIYFGGGYPEIFAKTLSTKTRLMARIKALSLSGMPIYGECGGFMYLCSRVSGMDGEKSHHMTGCFDFCVQMSKRLRSLGYREITLTEDTIIGKKGDVIRGHEFHYSSLKDRGSKDLAFKNVYHVTSRAGQDISLKGYQKHQTLGSYLHVHFGSNPGCAQTFVETCVAFRETRQDSIKTGPIGQPGTRDKEHHGV
jgi:cobyrinic acid a,c-diamide synthase